MTSVVMVTLWQSVGSNMVIYLAGLQGVPEYMYESAKLDGANAVQRFRYITWPPAQADDVPRQHDVDHRRAAAVRPGVRATQGGPANATKTPVYLIYQQGFNQLQMGYASAQAFVWRCPS